MSKSRLALAFIATAVVAACDSSTTAPEARAKRVVTVASTIEGDTTNCMYGWTVVQGRYECNP